MKKTISIRTIIQVLFFILVGGIAFNHTLAESGQSIPFLASASVHAICPFGGVVTLYQLFTTGSFIQKIHESAVVLMGIAFFLAILFGPVICGWICPLGSIQEWIGNLGRRVWGKSYNTFIPKKIDHILKYARYVILGMVIYKTATTGLLLFANVDPYYALFHFWTGETALAAIIILIVTLVGAFFVERPWCRYACPYGALLGLFNKVRIFKIKRNPSTCISCNACDRACPMGIEVSSQGAITDTTCISCMECTSEKHCPIPHTVELMVGVFSANDMKNDATGQEGR